VAVTFSWKLYPVSSEARSIIGGVGAFTGSLPLQVSILAGPAGYGLMLLGMAGAVAEFSGS